MALYTPEQIGIKAPPEGFKDLGWYGGRQYVGGTLGEANQIHPNSPQQGAGQPVSQEVVAQSAAAQGKTPEELNAYLQQQGQAIAGGGAKPATTSAPGGVAGMAGGAVAAPATIDLPTMYQNLYKEKGITDLEKQLADKQKAFTETKAKNNDNPFLSEATRVGREAKLQKLFDEQTANLVKDIATKKADIETQLNLQTKQFDINSQAARDSLARFNSLLEAGAYNNASGEDIANATRATGISSSMIQAAVDAAKAKNVKTQVITSTNDAGVVTASVINTQTGEVIKKTSLGAIGNAQNGTQADQQKQAISAMAQRLSDQAGQDGYVSREAWLYQLNLWQAAGMKYDDFLSNFKRFTNPAQPASYYNIDKEQTTSDWVKSQLK